MSDGTTRLDPDAAAGLIPNLVTQAELNEFGIENPSSDNKYIIGRGANDEKYKFEGEYS